VERIKELSRGMANQNIFCIADDTRFKFELGRSKVTPEATPSSFLQFLLCYSFVLAVDSGMYLLFLCHY
jgi:hypothetical protein